MIQLKTYLESQGITQSEFARKMSVSSQAVRYWVNRQRMPKPEQMKKIKIVTRGAVTPDDWLEAIEISLPADNGGWG